MTKGLKRKALNLFLLIRKDSREAKKKEKKKTCKLPKNRDKNWNWDSFPVQS